MPMSPKWPIDGHRLPLWKSSKTASEGWYQLQQPGTDLDLYFSTLAGYCSWGKRLLTWDDEKVREAKAYATQGFFEKHPEYRSLLPFIDQSDLNQELGIYEEMRTALFALVISLAHSRRACGGTWSTPGCRFLAGDYLDVWYDPALLVV